jgi:hypothetical protein
MAAPDLKTLYQQEEQLNEAFAGVLDAAAPTFYAHDTRERPANHNTVITELGAATGHEFRNGEWDTFAFRLRVNVVTERDTSEPTPNRHALQKGTVRALLSKLSGKFSTGNLPYLQITLLRPDGTTVEFNNDQNRTQDITVLEYAGVVAILENAWP